jgi:hypothetical protein
MTFSDNTGKARSQKGFQNKKRKKRRRSNSLPPLAKIAITLAVTCTLVVTLSFQPTIKFLNNLIFNWGVCNGVGNCRTHTTTNNYFPGAAGRRPQRPRSPQIDTPHQPSVPTQPSPTSNPNPVGNQPVNPPPTNQPATSIPTQRALEQTSIKANDYIYNPSRSIQQPPQPTLTESRSTQQQSWNYSAPPAANTVPPRSSYSRVEVTAEPSPTISPKASEHESHQTSIFEQLTPNNMNMGSSDDIPEPPATAGILAIMGFFGWITKRMQPQDSEDEE